MEGIPSRAHHLFAIHVLSAVHRLVDFFITLQTVMLHGLYIRYSKYVEPNTQSERTGAGEGAAPFNRCHSHRGTHLGLALTATAEAIALAHKCHIDHVATRPCHLSMIRS